MRPRDSIEASRAATHTTPGAMTRSIFISGPTPRGNRLTTMMKKKSVVKTSARRRIASRRSRRIIQRNISGELQPLGCNGGYLNLLVRCHHYHAALAQMLLQQALHQFYRRHIQGGQWLVQYPQYCSTYQ